MSGSKPDTVYGIHQLFKTQVKLKQVRAGQLLRYRTAANSIVHKTVEPLFPLRQGRIFKKPGQEQLRQRFTGAAAPVTPAPETPAA